MRSVIGILVSQIILMTGISLPASADWVTLCNARPGGGLILLKDAPYTGRCERQDTLMERANIIWEGLVARHTAPPSRLVIEGTIKNGQFVPERAHADSDKAAARLPMLPVGSNTLPLFDATAFGQEVRASVKRGNFGVRLSCAPGTKPAGMVLEPAGHRFYHGIDQSIVVAAVARGDFRSSMVVEGADIPPNAPMVPQNKTSLVKMPFARAPGLQQLVYLCPQASGVIHIKSVHLQLDAPSHKPKVLASWVWNPEEWQQRPAELLSWAKSMQLNRLYLQLDVSAGNVTKPDLLRAFLGNANALGIAVFAVEGDPHMIRGEGKSNALSRTKAITRFQHSVEPGSQLAGIQYDVEPYVLQAYAIDRSAVLQDWSRTLKELHDLWRDRVEVVVPFWLIDDMEGRKAIEHLRSFVSLFAVMSYRTEDQAIVEASEPWLHWGVLHGVDIVVALENGPIPDEVHQVYTRSETGTVEIVGFSIANGVLLSDRPVSSKERMIYGLSHAITVLGNRISFQGELPRLLETINRLRTTFPAWPSFSGFALHGVR